MKTYKSKTKRDYKGEYKYYHSLPEQIKRRAGRNNARRKMLRLGKVKLHAKNGGDVHHVHHHINGKIITNTWDNRLSNLRVMPKSKNRSIK
jgi:hypothetical protein